MDIERIVVRLVVDATSYVEGLNRAEARLLYFAGFVVEQVARSAITLAAEFERLKIAFEVMTGSAEEGLKVLNDITKLAIESPFTSTELIAAGKQAKAFGFDTNDLIPILSRLGDVSVATGTDINRIILAFGQVRTTGRLMGQELRQFTNAGVPILEYLAKATGNATSAIPQLVRQGRIGFADVANAFNMMTSQGGLFFGMMERTNLETVWGRWQNVVESLQVSMRNLGLEFFQLFRVKEILTSITDSLKAMNSEGGLEEMRDNLRQIKNTADFLLLPFRNAYEAVKELYVQNKLVLDTILLTVVATRAFTAALWLAQLPVAAIGLGLRVVHTTLVTIYGALRVILAVSLLIQNAALLNIRTTLRSILTIMLAIRATVIGTAVVAVATVLAGVLVVLLKIAVVVAVVVAAVVAAVLAWKVIVFFAKEVLNTLEAIGETDFWKMLVNVAEGVGATLAEWGRDAWAAIKKALGPVGLALEEFFASVADGWRDVWNNHIYPAIAPFVKQVQDEWAAFWGWFRESGRAAWEYVLGFFSRGMDQARAFGKLLSDAIGSMKDAITGGDAALGWDILFATLKVGWQRLLGWLKIEWKAFSDTLDGWLTESWDKFAIRSTYAAKIAAENLLAGGLRVPQMEAERDKLIRGVEAAAGIRRAGIQDDRAAMLRAHEENVARGPAMQALRNLQSLSDVLREAGTRVAELAKLYAEIPTREVRGIGGVDVVPDMSRFTPPELDLSALSAGVGATAAEAQYRGLAFRAMQSAARYQNMMWQNRDAVSRGERLVIPPDVLAAARIGALDAARALDQFVEAMSKASREARRAINVPLEISAGARALAAEVARDMERGLNPFEKFMEDWRDLTEAHTGPLQTPEIESAFGAVLGPALWGTEGLKAGDLISGIIGDAVRDFGTYRSYENMRKWLPSMETNRPTAAMQGSREAYEIMARANAGQTDASERIRAEIAMGNSIASAQWQEQQRTTAVLEALQKQGMVVPRRVGAGGR